MKTNTRTAVRRWLVTKAQEKSPSVRWSNVRNKVLFQMTGYRNMNEAEIAWRLDLKIGGRQPKIRVEGVSVKDDGFLLTFEWRRVRMLALTKYGARCQCCGATPADGVMINVDHIKPRRLFPQLALDVDNLQILCNPCNHGKGNWDQTDWREADQFDADNVAHIRSIK